MDPDYAKGWLRGLKCAIAMGNMKTARNMAEQVLNLAPGFLDIVEEEVKVIKTVEKLEIELDEALEKGNWSAALHCTEQLVQLCPFHHNAQVQRGELLGRRGAWAGVEEVATCVGPPSSLYILALVPYYGFRPREALQAFALAILADPSNRKVRVYVFFIVSFSW